MELVTSYSKCECGAITFYCDTGSAYSIQSKNKKKFFPNLSLRGLTRFPQTFCCDHCVNHYGLDLCACGSGEPVGKCANGLPECGEPMQVYGERTHVSAADAWLP